MRKLRIGKYFFFTFLIFTWVFSGWPPVWQHPRIPSSIEYALALNKTANWNFNGNSTGWTATNGSANTDGTGNPACGTTADTSQNNMATFAYNGSLSGQTAFGAVSGTAKGTWYAGNINQTFVAPGSGSVQAKGKFSYYGNGNFGTSKVSLEIWNNTNTTYVGSLGCVTMTGNTAWTATSLSSAVSLTGGTTYTIRVNFVSKTKTNTAAAITLGADNILVNIAPTGLSVSGPTNSKSASLSWTASTAGSGADGLHATTPYKVYRDTASPVSTFLANATTNSYTDSSTVGNTTYYYAVSDVDTASNESPLSAESSFLTKPDAPGTPTFSSVTDTTLTVSWTAPTGGASTYDVERCTGVSCSSGWTTVSSAQAGLSFGDSGLSANTTYGYRIVGNNATGAGVYSSTAYQTTSSSAVYSVSITSSGSISYGFVQVGTASSTVNNGYTQTAQNDGNTTEKLNVKSSDATGGTTWTLASAIGSNIFKHEFSTTTGSTWTVMPDSATYVTAAPSVAQSGTVNFDFQLTTPSASTDYQQKSITITVQAVAP